MKGPSKTIYRELKDIVAPEHTALVVWDVQNALVNMVFNREEFLASLKALISAARAKGVPVVYSKITPLPPQWDSPWRLYMNMRRFNVDDPAKLPAFLQPGTPESEIHADARPQPEDMVLNKHTASMFVGTHFENLMRNHGIDTLLFTGIATEIGVDSSARDAANRGFYTVVVEDCSSSGDKEMHSLSLKTLGRICLVMPSIDIIKAWQ